MLDREALKALLIKRQEDLRSLASSHENELRSKMRSNARNSRTRLRNCAAPAASLREVVNHTFHSDSYPDGGGQLRQFGEDVSEQLQHIPNRFKVICRMRPSTAASEVLQGRLSGGRLWGFHLLYAKAPSMKLPAGRMHAQVSQDPCHPRIAGNDKSVGQDRRPLRDRGRGTRETHRSEAECPAGASQATA